MLMQARKLIFNKRVTNAYCMTCHATFGKTISVMAGEAEEAGIWYGKLGARFIDWLLSEPHHCANQLFYYRRLHRL